MLKALVVDDCAVNRCLLEAILRHGACEPVLAQNGTEALEALSREAFDVVLMDLEMPAMSGEETTGAIRRLWPERSFWVIATSAGVEEGLTDALRAAGFDAVLPKPLGVAAVIGLLDSVRAQRAPCAGHLR